jgi:sulfate transport system substrate-binding protein
VTLSLVAYSTPQAAYGKLIAAFQQTAAGKNVKFTQSYGASGSQSRAVESGLKADIVAFSLEPDITRLVTDKIVAADWNSDQYHGMITDSVAVIGVRKGNPKNIKTWDDLVKPGVQVLTPNPFTSGGARWNILAGWGTKSNKGADAATGNAYLQKLFDNVPVQDKSAREALQTFVGGKGDVLLAYENEAITAQQKGEDMDYVVPDQTILIQNPIAATTTTKNASNAKAFVDFTRSQEAQKIFADKGYRSVIPSLVDKSKYPTPSGLFTIEKLGGWSKVNDVFFDPDNGKVAEIEKNLGVSTEK